MGEETTGNPAGRWVGPTRVVCPQECEVPAGAVFAEVPRPRHAWGDVLCCPNDGCERTFLVLAAPPVPAGAWISLRPEVEWVPGDPVYPEQAPSSTCRCGTSVTPALEEPWECPECGHVNGDTPPPLIDAQWMRGLAEALGVPVEMLGLPEGIGHWSTFSDARQRDMLRAFFVAAYPEKVGVVSRWLDAPPVESQ